MKQLYWQVYAFISQCILSFYLILRDCKIISNKNIMGYYITKFHIGDVFLDKRTKRTWRIIFIGQDWMGDYDLIIRDDQGRVRAIKDYNLSHYLCCVCTSKMLRRVKEDEDEKDKETEKLLDNYYNLKHKELLKINYNKAIVTKNGEILSMRRLYPCHKCGSTNVAEILYGDDYDAKWLEYHLKKGDVIRATASNSEDNHRLHCKNCGFDYR